MKAAVIFSSRFFVLVLVLIVSAAAHAQSNRSSISGFVFSPDRKPVGQVYVELLNEVNSMLARTRTDGSGRYFFGGLSQGRFTIKVLPFATNYLEQTVDVEISGVGITGRALSDNVQQDVYLRIRKGADAVPFMNVVVYAQEVPEQAQAAYKSAVDDLEGQRTQAGVDGLMKAIEIFPNYFDALQRLGVTRISQQDYPGAKDAFTKALAVNSRSFDCWYGLGYSNYALKDAKAAVDSVGKAVGIKPESIEANFLLGITYRQLKDYTKAEAALKQAAKIGEGSSPDVHWNLALLYAHNLQRYKDAAEQLELYLKAAGDIPNKDDIKKLIKQFRQKAAG